MLDENSSKIIQNFAILLLKIPPKICYVSGFHFLLALFFFRKNLSTMLARNEKTNSKHKFFFWFSKIWQNFGAFHWNINFFLLNIHKEELCFSSSGRPNLKGQVCKLASRNGNFFPRLIFCSLKQKVAALLHFTVPLCFCVEVVGATIIYI